ncbi:BRO family protein [Corynebacterium mastitidis]|uniref:BRO family protein n=1 Tax=Corynebacterium mastitidis TaxID=161890 RepID=A0ABU8P1A9_9CORY
MMDIQQFDFKGQDVRVIADDPERPMWVARDVASDLGYKRPNDAVNAHCKGAAIRRPLQTAGGVQQVRVIAEPDLYRLIVNSELESAQEFERLVFEEILPSIRKRGGYLTPAAAEEALTNPDFIIRLATDLKEERARRAEL